MESGRAGGRSRPVQEVAEGIFRIEVPLPENPLRAVNAYVIRGKGRSLVVDTGMRRTECADAMASGLDAIGIAVADCDFFITHFHADHLGLVSDLATAGTTIYLNAPDSTRILGAGGGFRDRFIQSARLNGFPEINLYDAIDSHPARLYGPRLPLPFTDCPDGGTIHIGAYDFRCIETPGHSFGHTCLYDAARKLLISGDHILSDITPNLQGWFQNWNPLKEYLKSLERTALLDVELVLPGHRKVFTDMRGRIEELKEHHDRRAEEVLSALAEGPKTAYGVAAGITWDIACDSFEDFPLPQKWFALGETIAHLQYLQYTRRVRRNVESRAGRRQAFWRLP